MKKTVNGSKYIFISELNLSSPSYFEIMAIHKHSERKSFITNLNFIISELGRLLSEEDEKFETTWTILNHDRAEHLWNESSKMFDDTEFVHYLEKMCDDDRFIGGWNSDF